MLNLCKSPEKLNAAYIYRALKQSLHYPAKVSSAFPIACRLSRRLDLLDALLPPISILVAGSLRCCMAPLLSTVLLFCFCSTSCFPFNTALVVHIGAMLLLSATASTMNLLFSYQSSAVPQPYGATSLTRSPTPRTDEDWKQNMGTTISALIVFACNGVRWDWANRYAMNGPLHL